MQVEGLTLATRVGTGIDAGQARAWPRAFRLVKAVSSSEALRALASRSFPPMRRCFLAVPLLLAGCGDAPSMGNYPDAWQRPARESVRVDGERCPVLTGTYTLPRAIKDYPGARHKGDLIFPHQFLGFAPTKVYPPTRMTLAGPTPDGLAVTFLRDDVVMATKTLVPGKDFRCVDGWVKDARASERHDASSPHEYFARSRDGKLIGHLEYSGAWGGVLFGWLPLAGITLEYAWWQVDPE